MISVGHQGASRDLFFFHLMFCTLVFQRCGVVGSLVEVARSRSRHLCGAGPPCLAEVVSQAQALRADRGAARGDRRAPAISPVFRGGGARRQLLLCHAWAMGNEGTVAAICFRSQRAQ